MRYVHHAVSAILCLWIGGCVTGPTPQAAGPGLTTDSDWFRRSEPLDRGTIFSALNLPQPTPARSASGVPGPAYWQQRADYVIRASLDDRENAVSGSQRVMYTNNSPDPLWFIWIHLEQNYFQDDSLGSLMREDAGRFGNRASFRGGFEGVSVRAGGVDLPMAVYDTIARIDLPAPIPPGGGRFEFEMEWSFRIPEYGADRLGIDPTSNGLIYQLAQWFPCLAVYDDVHGWNTHGYLGQGEFYTDFGDYEVSITVPRSHLVAATGVLQNPAEVLTAEQVERLDRARSSEQTVVIRSAEEVTDPSSRPPGDGPLTWRFIARDVRTFAWSSSPAFVWDAASIPTRGRSPADQDPTRAPPPGTLVQSVYPVEALPLWSQSTQMLRFAIEGYGRRWFTYPYPTAINVNGRAGGMEYPMIIFCRERRHDRGLYGVTTHEIGHNWFPMIVSTDEKRHAWMDEGFNSFINYYSNAEYWNEPPAGRGSSADFARVMTEPDQQPMDTPADRVRDGRLGSLQYAKPAVMLVLLREVVLGEDRFDAAFRRYISSWAFRSPRPWDFIRCMENAAGADLAWFWRGWIYGTGTLDHAVTGAEFV
ncbi:MAG TPA: M1 family metallopeptidase, partial [Phycisphaerales bacterium]|nr:M1 family metallopeptidase [Phycisphaerales bacterium]